MTISGKRLDKERGLGVSRTGDQALRNKSRLVLQCWSQNAAVSPNRNKKGSSYYVRSGSPNNVRKFHLLKMFGLYGLC